MIRPLTEPDRAQTLALLRCAPEFNLYMLGNLAALGFETDFNQFWGDFGIDGALRAVLNRYMSGWTLYGRADADWVALGQIVDEHPVAATRLQDNPGGIASFLPFVAQYEVAHLSTQTLMHLNKQAFAPADPPPGVRVRRASLADLDRLAAFYADAEQMTRARAGVEQPLRHRRVWLAEQDGRILSAALTNAETGRLAMIGGVFTAPAARGCGLGKAVCSALCAELLAAGRRPVLYWETPAAGAVYRRLGFRTVGAWRSVRLRPSGARRHGPGDALPP
jgi:hypothetical protein